MSNKKEALRIIPLGGLGEVGKNMMVYEFGADIMIVDSGLMFPENDMLGIDYIIPDFQYLEGKAQRVRGIIITHGHEDHIGAIRHVIEKIPAPIYATPLTRGLIEVKLNRHGKLHKTKLNTIQAGDKINIGRFQVECFHVCHSVPDAIGLGITTPAGLVVHTGDYKFDQTPVDGWPTDFAQLAEFSRRGVTLLLADSTNADRPGWTPSEQVIGPALDEVFRNAPGRIIVATFASLISRMQQVVDAAIRHKRKIAFVGMSMVDNAKIARELGYLEVDDKTMVNIDQALKMPDDEVVLMCTGSQGEPSSIIGRLSAGTNRQFDVKSGDTVVLSSHPIPGNEETISRTINRLFRRGANVIYEAIAPVHVSGHASQEELKLLLNLVRPKHFIPIHGELRHLKHHAILAGQVGIPENNISVIENGQIVELKGGKLHLAERIPGGYVFVEGESIGEVKKDVMREREQLSRSGIVLVDIRVDKYSGRQINSADIITRGFISNKESKALTQTIQKKVTSIIDGGGLDDEKLITDALRTLIHQETKRRPFVLVTLNRV